jgi:hypothetical protein
MQGRERALQEAVAKAAAHRKAKAGILWPSDVQQAMVAAALAVDDGMISAMHDVAERYEKSLQREAA